MPILPSIILSSRSEQNAWECAGASALSLICDSTQRVRLLRGNDVLQEWRDPLMALDWMSSGDSFTESSQRWVGYLSYDVGRWFERLPARAADDLNLPAFRFDRIRPSAAADLPLAAQVKNDRVIANSASQLPSTFTRSDYLAVVQRAKDFIAAGDVFQVNLSQRLTVPSPIPPVEIFGRLQREFPADFAALLNYGDYAIVSNSPELFFQVERAGNRRRIVNRPIKGTRPRDEGMEQELRDSLKDQAELNMIVDLQRNDLGRVCEIGSVKVIQPRAIESHPTVFHGVATIEGMLRPEVGFVDLLRAVFPCGSITGCPKIRAMEIIEELEPVRRGPYCGAIGYVAADSTMAFNVAIRTMTVKNGLAYVPVGGGVVADSDPAKEYEETWVKARAMLEAMGRGPHHS